MSTPAPDRILLAKGARGELVRTLQLPLKDLGLYRADVDSDYGDLTAGAVQAFRKAKGLPLEGAVDVSTWQQVTKRDVPPLRDRALQVTAAFEGHGFTLAQGNFDGAGLTWGVIGFTLRSQLPAIVLEAQSVDPSLVKQAFRKKTDELLAVMRAPWPRRLAWADRLSLGSSKARLAEPWRSAFGRFGELPEVQEIQLRHVDEYFEPALRTAAALGLATELGIALSFDIHVQNGGISVRAEREIEAQRAKHPIGHERDLRVIVAHAVANASNPRYRQDVLSRKLTLATGAGAVHGGTYVLRNWGLADLPV